MRRRHELTDEQWETIEHLLPGRARVPGRTAADNRLFVNAVLFVARTGVPPLDLPARPAKPAVRPFRASAAAAMLAREGVRVAPPVAIARPGQ